MDHMLGYLMALATGLSLGLLGSGGSLLAVPALIYFFHEDAVTAASYSLFVVGLTSLVGFSLKKRGESLEWAPTLAFAIPSLIAVFLVRKYVVHALPDVLTFPWGPVGRDQMLIAVFGMVMLAAGISMLLHSGAHPGSRVGERSRQTRTGLSVLGCEGLLVGTITGFAGAGGGFLIVPAITLLGRIPFKTAVLTSLMIISVQSLAGFLGDFAAAETIRWEILLWFSLVSIAGVAAGNGLAKLWAGERLKLAFGWFTIFVSLAILAREFLPGGIS